MRHDIRSLEELQDFAHTFVSRLKPQKEGATIVALHGDLGAGKTSFVQCVARAFGVEEHVTSPTFVLEKVYKLEGQVFEYLIHIDAYRLESGEELKALGWSDMVENPRNIIFIEWAERVEDILPKEAIHLSFEYINEQTRTITE